MTWTVASSQSTSVPSIQILLVGVIGTLAPPSFARGRRRRRRAGTSGPKDSAGPPASPGTVRAVRPVRGAAATVVALAVLVGRGAHRHLLEPRGHESQLAEAGRAGRQARRGHDRPGGIRDREAPSPGGR